MQSLRLFMGLAWAIVSVASGVVQVRGLSSDRQMKEQILSVVRSIPGIKEVKLELSVVDRDYY